MPDPRHHSNCPLCKGEGFYLAYEGQGYMRDGSFSHNRWEDCRCTSDWHPEPPKAPPPVVRILEHPLRKGAWYYVIINRSGATPQRIKQLGLDGIE